MLKTRYWQPTWAFVSAAFLPVALGVAFTTATTAPVTANPVVVIEPGLSYGVIQPPPATSFIYGSPIPTPMLVNPATGHAPSRNYHSYPVTTPNYHSYPVTPPNYYSYPVRGSVVNSTLLNPILVNPRIRDSTLINPVILNNGRYGIPAFGHPRIILYR